jgi:hypothetical protein
VRGLSVSLYDRRSGQPGFAWPATVTIRENAGPAPGVGDVFISNMLSARAWKYLIARRAGENAWGFETVIAVGRPSPLIRKSLFPYEIRISAPFGTKQS